MNVQLNWFMAAYAYAQEYPQLMGSMILVLDEGNRIEGEAGLSSLVAM